MVPSFKSEAVILEKFQGEDFQKFCFTFCACNIYNYLEFILLLCC